MTAPASLAATLPDWCVLKYSPRVGWFVDGVCGYKVAGYYQTPAAAVSAAWSAIRALWADDDHPRVECGIAREGWGRHVGGQLEVYE